MSPHAEKAAGIIRRHYEFAASEYEKHPDRRRKIALIFRLSFDTASEEIIALCDEIDRLTELDEETRQ